MNVNFHTYRFIYLVYASVPVCLCACMVEGWMGGRSVVSSSYHLSPRAGAPHSGHLQLWNLLTGSTLSILWEKHTQWPSVLTPC